MIMDSNKHQSLSGEKAKISQRVGGKLTGWWPDHYSIAIFDISKVKGGSKLKFTQIGIPLIDTAATTEAGSKPTGHR
jgi:hypothetical protein